MLTDARWFSGLPCTAPSGRCRTALQSAALFITAFSLAFATAHTVSRAILLVQQPFTGLQASLTPSQALRTAGPALRVAGGMTSGPTPGTRQRPWGHTALGSVPEPQPQAADGAARRRMPRFAWAHLALSAIWALPAYAAPAGGTTPPLMQSVAAFLAPIFTIGLFSAPLEVHLLCTLLFAEPGRDQTETFSGTFPLLRPRNRRGYVATLSPLRVGGPETAGFMQGGGDLRSAISRNFPQFSAILDCTANFWR